MGYIQTYQQSLQRRKIQARAQSVGAVLGTSLVLVLFSMGAYAYAEKAATEELLLRSLVLSSELLKDNTEMLARISK